MADWSRNQLLAEAEAQNKALKRIKRWLVYAIGLSTIGAAFTYFAFSGETINKIIAVVGILIVFFSIGAAFLINLGIKKGIQNVERILAAAEKKAEEKSEKKK